MDFLALVKRLASETGTELVRNITTVDPAIDPATEYGDTTEHRHRLVDWTQQSWIDVQEDQDQWDFMIRTVRVDIAKGQISYDIKSLVDAVEGSDIYDNILPFVAHFDRRYIWLADGSVDPPTINKCYYVPPERFFGEFDRYNNVAWGIPSSYSIERDGCLILDSQPSSDNYYLEFEYKLLPQVLTDDTDTPRFIKEKYHILIVYQAMLFYAGFDESDPQWKRAKMLHKKQMNKLRLTDLRDYSVAGTRT